MEKNIMKTGAIGVFLVIPILMTGCELNNFHPEGPPFNGNNALVNAVNEYLANQQRRYNCLVDYRFYSFYPKEVQEDSVMVDGKCEGKRGDNSNGQVEAQTVRNETLAKGLTVIDANYQEWVNYLYLGRASGNFIADTIELTTSGVIGALSGPANTLSALGVGLTTFKGARSSFDLNYFEKQNTTILVNQMDTNRAKVYEVILTKKTRPITEYPMAEAIRDLVAYHNAGTPINALTALSRQTGKTAENAEDRIRILQGIPLSPPEIPQTNFTQAYEANKINSVQALASTSRRDELALKAKIVNLELAKVDDIKVTSVTYNSVDDVNTLGELVFIQYTNDVDKLSQIAIQKSKGNLFLFEGAAYINNQPSKVLVFRKHS
jgi:hypothetical protein